MQRISALCGCGDDAGGYEPVELASHFWTLRGRGNQFRDVPPTCSDYDPLSGLDSPNVSAEIVPEFVARPSPGSNYRHM